MRVVDYTEFYRTAQKMIEQTRHDPLYLKRRSDEPVRMTNGDSLIALTFFLESEVESLRQGPLKPKLERDIVQLQGDIEALQKLGEAMYGAMKVELQMHYADVFDQLELAHESVRHLRRQRENTNQGRTIDYLNTKIRVIEIYMGIFGESQLTKLIGLELEGIKREIDERNKLELSLELPN